MEADIGPKPKQLTALRAQRLLRTLNYRVAPAGAAGLMAGGHTGRFGTGAIVAGSMFGASLALDRSHHPLHLMPLAGVVVRTAVPLLGMLIALVISALAGTRLPLSDLVSPTIGAWVVMGIGGIAKARFESSRKVRLAVIGPKHLAVGLHEELHSVGIDSFEVVGWVTASQGTSDPAVGPRRLGSLDEIREVVGSQSIDLLIHGSDPNNPGHKKPSRLEIFERVADACLDMPVRLIEANQLYEDVFGHVPLGQSNSAWFQYLLHPRYRGGAPISKRAFDLVVGTVMLIVLAPVLTAFALAVKLTDGGPVFFRQRRVGEGGHEFEMIKLRSMRVAAESEGAAWSTADDDRITAVGRIMRKTHMDELIQLWNVLKGEMTIVGPRPERHELIIELEQQLNYYDRRHLVKPGIAGWAQARCGYGGSEEGTGWKLCHDLYYLKHRSVYFDLLILIENVRVSLRSGVQFDVQAPQEQFILRQQVS